MNLTFRPFNNAIYICLLRVFIIASCTLCILISTDDIGPCHLFVIICLYS